MKDFDTEVEKALKRAEKASAFMTVLSIVMLVLAVLGGGVGGVGVAIAGVIGAAVIYGIAVIINLLGMQLVVAWGQIRRQDNNSQ